MDEGIKLRFKKERKGQKKVRGSLLRNKGVRSKARE